MEEENTKITKMAIEKKNTVSFSDIFDFAEKEFKVSWNEANDLFFHTILTYKSTNEFYVHKGQIEDFNHWPDGSKQKRALEIMQAFMVENKVNSLLVLND